MTTHVEQVPAGTIHIAHGFVVLRPDGSRLDDHLHPNEASARVVADHIGDGHFVRPAKRVGTINRRKHDWIIGETI